LVRVTVGRVRDLRGIRNIGNGAERLWGLSVRRDDTSGVGVHSWRILVITVTDGILVGSVAGWGNIVATHTIEDVVAVLGRVSNSGVTCLETKNVGTHEVVPLDHLLVAIVVTVIAWECVGVDKTSQGVSSLISAVGIHLASSILRVKVDVDLIDESGDLNVGRGLEELDASESSSWHHARPMAGLAAPGNGSSLGVTDSRVGNRGSPHTEIINAVDEGGLTLRVGAFSRAVANIIT